MDTASLILFGIRASARLGEAGFKVFVDMTRNRDIVLPLPEDFRQPLPEVAYSFFYDNRGEGRQFCDPNLVENPIFDEPWPRVVALKKDFSNLSEAQKAELVSLSREGKRLIAVAKEIYTVLEEKPIPVSDMIALTSITGWREGESERTAIQRIAGSLIEIGVDFAVQNPGLFDTKSTVGKTLHALIKELDTIPFSEVEVDELPARLFLAVLETATASPDIFTGEKRIQTLISSAGKKVALLVSDRMGSINESDLTVTEKRARRRDVEEWGELVFRGVLDAAGRVVLSEPGRFLTITDTGSQEMIRRVGNDVIDLILADDRLSLDPIFSRQGTRKLMQTALEVVAKHPKLIMGSADSTALSRILTAVAEMLSTSDDKLVRDNLLPDIARLVLKQTVDNLNLLWPAAPDAPETNILLVVAEAILEGISRPEVGGVRHLDLTDSEVLSLLESVFEEVNRSPAWMTGDNAALGSVLKRVLKETVKTIHRHKLILTKRAILSILGHVLCGIIHRKEFSDEVMRGETTTPVVVAAMDAVLCTISETSDVKVKWQLLHEDLLNGLVAAAIGALAKSRADAAAIEALEKGFSDLVGEIMIGKTLDMGVLKKTLNSRLGSGIALEVTQ